jgi:hypothetical protein
LHGNMKRKDCSIRNYEKPNKRKKRIHQYVTLFLLSAIVMSAFLLFLYKMRRR